MNPVVEIIGVRKAFAGLIALDNLDIRVCEGSLFGLVGANGAGKTTALDIVGGQVQCDHGCVRVNGEDLRRRPPWRRALAGVGRTFQESRLWPELTTEEHLRVASEAHSGRFPRRVTDICAVVELADGLLKLFPSQMRLVDRRRLELIMAAINASNILLVDEVGAGLDDTEARGIYEHISQLVSQRQVRAALLVEHKLELLTSFASELALIESGAIRIKADTTNQIELLELFDQMFTNKNRKLI